MRRDRCSVRSCSDPGLCDQFLKGTKGPRAPGSRRRLDTREGRKEQFISTYEVVYNGVATVYNSEKPGEVDYYVAYTATVNAGFDINNIEITKDDEKKEIVISLPAVEVFEPKVKIEELDYIVVGKKVKTETISADAYKICKQDVAEKARNQAEIYKYAKANGERLIKGLVMPFVEKLDEKYTVKFVWRDIR